MLLGRLTGFLFDEIAEVVGRKEYLVCKLFDGGITLIFRILSLKIIIQQIFELY